MRYVGQVQRNGSGLFELMRADLEGIVAKLRHGNYVSVRERSTWYKIKNRNYFQSEVREELFERDSQAEPLPHSAYSAIS